MQKLKMNIIANYVGKGWSVVSNYLFVPAYLHFLGIEAYGLVGFYAVLLGVLAFADMGLTATLNREMARLSGFMNNEEEMRQLVRTVEMIYMGISIVIAMLVIVLANPIAYHWLKASDLSASNIVRSIRLMGFSLVFQFPARMFLGGLLGLQKQVLANSILIGMGLFRSGGAALVLWLLSPTVEVFFLWQVLSSILLLLLLRQSLWAALPGKFLKTKPSISVFKGIIRYTIGMALISLNSIILMQMDKIIISKMLSLKILAFYSLANTLAQAPLLLSTPIAIAIFPQLTQLIVAGKEEALARTYHRANQLVAAIVFPVGLTLVVFSHELLLLWTRSPEAADNAHRVASLLIVGSIALSVQAIPFRLALAAAWTRLTIYLGVGSITITAPLLIFLVKRYGMLGAGMTWIVLNCFIVIFFIIFLHRKLLRGHATRWFLYDMAPSAFISLFFAKLGHYCIIHVMDGVASVMIIGFVIVASAIVCLLLFLRGPNWMSVNSKTVM